MQKYINNPYFLFSMDLGAFVRQVIIQLHSQKVSIPSYRDARWHKLLYRFKKENIANKPGFFQNLGFNWDGEYPKSPGLNDVLEGIHCFTCKSYFDNNTMQVKDDVMALWMKEIPYHDVNSDYMQHAIGVAKSLFEE